METLADVKQFAAEVLGEEHLDEVLSERLLPRWVARGLEKIFRKTWYRFNEDKITLTWPSSSSTTEGSILYLPHFVYRPIEILPVSGQYPVAEIVSSAVADRRRFSTRPYFVLHGYYSVEADNPSTGVLTVACAGGVGNQTVRVRGLDASNYELNETVTVAAAGSTPTVGSFKAGVGGVQGVELFGDPNGGIITVSRGGTTIERLNSNFESRHEHLRSEFVAGTFVLRFWRRPKPPVNDTEALPIPFEFHSLIENWVEGELYRWRGEYEQSRAMKMEFESELMELVRFDRRDPAMRDRIRVVWGSGGRRWY